jgi:pilus assembly protein FimV
VDVELDLDDGDLPTPPAAAAPSGSTLAPLDFDLGDLSLDLDGPTVAPAASLPPTDAKGPSPGDFDLIELSPADDADDKAAELLRKFERAESLIVAGDRDTAQALLRDVLAQADGALKADAKRLLDRLGKR